MIILDKAFLPKGTVLGIVGESGKYYDFYKYPKNPINSLANGIMIYVIMTSVSAANDLRFVSLFTAKYPGKEV